MRILRRLIPPTALVVLLLFGLFAAMDYFAALETGETPPSGTAEPLPADPRNPLQITERQRREPASARPVNPDLFAQPFAENVAELWRVVPRAPLTPASEPEEADSTLLHRPVALDAGNLSFDGNALRLDGIEPTPADRMCENGDGGQWPCGMVARTAFRNYLRGRALRCDVTNDSWQDAAIATCRLRDDDIAAWLAENGWAAAEADSPYAALTEDAQAEARGVFGPDPRQ